MKNQTFKAALITGACTIIAALIGLASCNDLKGAIEDGNVPAEIGDSSESGDISVTNDEGTVMVGDGNTYVGGDINYDNSTNVTYSLDVTKASNDDKLKMAQRACVEGDYDIAYDIYIESDEQIALLNLGYIYANGISYVGEDKKKAEECYKKANCLEAKRNLLIFYLENERVEEAQILFVELLWGIDDKVTWDYVANCLFNQSWDEYQAENGIEKETFSFDFSKLYEWEETDNYYRGFNPPGDTIQTRWIWQGTDFDTSGESNHSYDVYRAQRCVFTKGWDTMQCMYYEVDGKLEPMEN